MFALATEGRTSLFERLVACIVSIRTRDEVSVPAALRLLRLGRTPAVGPKCANLALGIACGAAPPSRRSRRSRRCCPGATWVELNALLVPFGKHICTGRLPRRSTCPVLDLCRQVGVGEHRRGSRELPAVARGARVR